MPRELNIDIGKSDGEYISIKIRIGSHVIEDRIKIRCPNEKKSGQKHEFNKNGHDTSVKNSPQQYNCDTCGKSFYGHTSKFFDSLKSNIKETINDAMKRGRIDIKALARRMNLNKSTISRLIHQILLQVIQTKKKTKTFKTKKRRSNCLLVDETFLKIAKKTWYLILVISGNNKVMAVRLVKKRSKAIILEMVRDCASRLLYGLQMLFTDGFKVYVGVARDLNQDLIHVRHIHKPPYGRIEIDTYSYDQYDVTRTTLKTTNEITAVNGYFLGQVRVKKTSLGNRKRGRKTGTKNRAKKEIKAEKKEKAKNIKKRGRPAGKKSKPKWDVQVFNHNKKKGCITAVDDSSMVLEATLNKILKQFPNMHVTTNLVEKEFSVLKKLIDFRGRRNLETWETIISAFYIIRDDPKFLEKALKHVEISFQMVNRALSTLTTCEVCSS